MGRLVVDDSGRLDVESVASLSLDEIRGWVSARLHGRDTAVPSDVRQGELPHYLLAQIYPNLDRDSRDYILLAVREFLNDMSRNRESPWRGEAAHALLLLAQRLGERSLIPPIREMAEDGRFFTAESRADELHRRVLQSLVALRWQGTREFWREQYGRAPERYAGVVFAGLSQIALQHAFDLLPEVPWDNADVRAQMRVALRGLLPAYDHSVIGNFLTRVNSQLTSRVQDVLMEFLPEVALFVERAPVWQREKVREALASLGQTDFSPKHLSSFAAAVTTVNGTH